ncbi:hypothetical protein ACFQQB_11685 [Nonomuraea rubra]|uniref:hypothetical protein n=1 Tax=Nonomuraea rubra TaxID=46180 RepID=UPI00360D889D
MGKSAWLIFPNAVNDASHNRFGSFNSGAAFFTGSSRPLTTLTSPVALAHSTIRFNPGNSVLLFVRNTRSPIFGSISSPVFSSATSVRASDSVRFPV